MLKVQATGPQLLYQDPGRSGMAGLGVAPSGSFDRMSAARANHAMGNAPEAPVIEVLYGGAEFEALTDAHLILTGMRSRIDITHADGSLTSTYSNVIIDVVAGDRIAIKAAHGGMRGYLALRGGCAPTPVLGSSSTDVMSGLGPAPIAAGDIVNTGNFIAELAWWPRLRELPTLWPWEEIRTLSVVLGPRADWFTPESLDAFFSQTYEVSDQSNRIGLRLSADTPLTRAHSQELPSEGMVRGSIQVPPNGMPVIFGPDYPVTGGYPVIGVLTRRSSDYSAQCAPGDKVRFVRAH